MDQNQNEGLTPEEIKAEEEALKEVSEDEVRQRVVSELGLDENDHAEIIEKAVQKELTHIKTKASLTRQKASWRTKATEKPKPQSTSQNIDPDEILKKAEERVEQRFEQRDLKSLKLPEQLETLVKSIAKVNGISVLEAASDEYFLLKKEAYEKEQKTTEAAISRNNKTAAQTTFDPNSPPKLDPSIDINTPEGKAAYEKYQKDKANWIEQAKKQ